MARPGRKHPLRQLSFTWHVIGDSSYGSPRFYTYGTEGRDPSRHRRCVCKRTYIPCRMRRMEPKLAEEKLPRSPTPFARMTEISLPIPSRSPPYAIDGSARTSIPFGSATCHVDESVIGVWTPSRSRAFLSAQIGCATIPRTSKPSPHTASAIDAAMHGPHGSPTTHVQLFHTLQRSHAEDEEPSDAEDERTANGRIGRRFTSVFRRDVSASGRSHVRRISTSLVRDEIEAHAMQKV